MTCDLCVDCGSDLGVGDSHLRDSMGGEFNMLTAHTHTFYVKIFSDSMVGAGFGKCLPSV